MAAPADGGAAAAAAAALRYVGRGRALAACLPPPRGLHGHPLVLRDVKELTEAEAEEEGVATRRIWWTQVGAGRPPGARGGVRRPRADGRRRGGAAAVRVNWGAARAAYRLTLSLGPAGRTGEPGTASFCALAAQWLSRATEDPHGLEDSLWVLGYYRHYQALRKVRPQASPDILLLRAISNLSFQLPTVLRRGPGRLGTCGGRADRAH